MGAVDANERMISMKNTFLMLISTALILFLAKVFADGDMTLSAKQIRPGCSVVVHKEYPSGVDPNINSAVFDQQLRWKCDGARQSRSERSRHKVVGRKSSRSSIDPMRSLSWRAGVQMQPARISTGTSIRSVHFVLRRSASRLGSRRCWPSPRRLAMATMACLMEDVSRFPTRMLHRSVHA